MRFRLLLAAAPLVLLPASVFAQEAPAENIAVMGKDYSVVPFDMEQPSLSWKEVRPCLPASIAEAPPQPVNDAETLELLGKMQAEAEARYEALMTPAVDNYTKTHPKLKPEDAEFRVISEGLKKSDPPGEFYKAACAYLALTYLHDMLYAKITPPPAPGGMPEP
jgi:hypothetical protein